MNNHRPRLVASSLAVLLLGPASPVRGEQSEQGCRTAKCHADLGRDKHSHGPVAAGICRPCHAPRVFGLGSPIHVKGQMEIPVATAKLCLGCHVNIAQQLKSAHPHRPVRETACGLCHDAHGTGRRFMLRDFGKLGAKDPYCYLCHKRKAFTGKVAHQAFVAQPCRRCHQAHGSATEGLLVSDQRRLCIGCHKVSWRKRKVVHAPVAAGICTACHAPHRADRGALLRFAQKPICRACHDEAERLKSAHASVDGYKPETCPTCHEVHASNRPHLLKDKR